MTKIYVTKDALTSGPLEVDAELKESVACGQYATWTHPGSNWFQSAHGKEFWLTPEEAIADCERRRDDKLRSLEKQKKKLEKLTFTFDKVIK